MFVKFLFTTVGEFFSRTIVLMMMVHDNKIVGKFLWLVIMQGAGSTDQKLARAASSTPLLRCQVLLLYIACLRQTI